MWYYIGSIVGKWDQYPSLATAENVLTNAGYRVLDHAIQTKPTMSAIHDEQGILVTVVANGPPEQSWTVTAINAFTPNESASQSAHDIVDAIYQKITGSPPGSLG
jgi:hypothetical protein